MVTFVLWLRSLIDSLLASSKHFQWDSSLVSLRAIVASRCLELVSTTVICVHNALVYHPPCVEHCQYPHARNTTQSIFSISQEAQGREGSYENLEMHPKSSLIHNPI
jgi:hypothetical protein